MTPVLASILGLMTAQPPELGQVAWLRDFEAARAAAAQAHKPLLVLFDEVPGCQTVLGFGRGALSHPDVVAAIQEETVPVAIYNNVGGADRAVLESFREPTWNNPVVRVMDAERRPLGPRFAGPYDVESFARALAAALEAAGRPVPARLAKLARLTQRAAPEKATFAMYCFWEGEAQLGAIEGVVAARAGFVDGREAVEVEFDPQIIDRRALVERAKAALSTLVVMARSEAELAVAQAAGARAERTGTALRPSAADTKYYLQRSAYRDAGLSELEALKVNAALRLGRDPERARLAAASAR